MFESFRLYTDRDLSICCTKSIEDKEKYTTDDFFVLACTSDYSCGIDLLKIYIFKNKYDALNYFYDLIKEWKDTFTSLDYRRMCKNADDILRTIKTNKMDKNVHLNVFNFSNEDLSFEILVEGYWNEAVVEIINHIKDGLDIEIEFLENDIEEKESIKLLSKKIADCDILLNCNDLNSENFLVGFRSICTFFNNYFDPFK